MRTSSIWMLVPLALLSAFPPALAQTSKPAAAAFPDVESLRAWWYAGRWPLPAGLDASLPAYVEKHPEDAEAAFFLAALHGRNVPGFAPDSSKSAPLLRRAAGAGYMPAVARLGLLTVEGGEGIEADPQAGFKMLEQAVQANDRDGLLNAGWVKLDGLGGTPRDLAGAEALLRRAHDAGHVRAYAGLGTIQAAKGDLAKAVELLKAGAAAGDPNSMGALGAVYRQGIGVTASDTEAFAHMLAASERGMDDAQRHLAEMYRDGEGTRRDPVAALNWARRSAAAGNARAKHFLADAYLAGDGLPADPAAAMTILAELAKANDVAALVRLGRANLEGLWLKRDLARAKELFETAEALGSADASAYLRWIRAATVH